jgi:non-specific serine/threonine protein kinase/protein-serine/threonine kinase
LSTKGYWRYAWQYHQTSSNNALVLKTFRLEHSLEEAYLEYQRIDALVMERFTSMPSILDIFSYCGLSVLTEYADRSLSRVVDKLKTSPVKLLKLAKKVTNGVVALHHAGVVHNDLNPGNLAYSDDKQVPILFDFNLAVLLRTENNNHTCPFVSKYTNPQWRAPEEQEIGTHLTAKTDVYALGNVLFRFATGDSPWGRGRKTPEEKDFIMERKLQGYYPPFSTSKLSLAGHHLVEIMKQCYQVHPKHRPSARRVVAMLNMAIHNLTATELP